MWRGKASIQTDRFCHWQESEFYVFLMYKSGAKTFKVHAENIYEKGNLGQLKRNVKEIVRLFQEALKGSLYGELKYYVDIMIEGSVMRGNPESLWGRLKRQLKENIPTELYVPIASLILSLMRGLGTQDALTNVGIAILAMLLWIVVEVVFKGQSFEYKEERS